MNKLKKIIAFCYLLMFTCSINITTAQNNQSSNNNSETKTLANSFTIHGKLSGELLSFYSKSIEAADFEQFRLKTTSVILKFKNGFLLELFSAKELVIKNKEVHIDINKYADNVTVPGYKYPLFEVLNSGWITAGVENTNSK